MEYLRYQEDLRAKGDKRVRLPGAVASGPKENKGEVGNNDANSSEPKPATVGTLAEPKPAATVGTSDEQEHHAERPPEKKRRRNAQVGERFKLETSNLQDLSNKLENTWWPKLETSGYGITLGTTHHDGHTRLSLQNDKNEELIRDINKIINDKLGAGFRWNTLQIQKNSITRPQVALSHVGTSVMILLGDFTGGAFRAVDSSYSVSTPNSLLIYNAHKPHLSEHFSGTRFSVACYFRGEHKDLSQSDRNRLKSLGFGIDHIPDSPITTTVTGDIDPL